MNSITVVHVSRGTPNVVPSWRRHSYWKNSNHRCCCICHEYTSYAHDIWQWRYELSKCRVHPKKAICWSNTLLSARRCLLPQTARSWDKRPLSGGAHRATTHTYEVDSLFTIVSPGALLAPSASLLSSSAFFGFPSALLSFPSAPLFLSTYFHGVYSDSSVLASFVFIPVLLCFPVSICL